MSTLSHARARLASFDHAYVIATRLRQITGRLQFIVLADDPIQPVRVSDVPPEDSHSLLVILV